MLPASKRPSERDKCKAPHLRCAQKSRDNGARPRAGTDKGSFCRPLLRYRVKLRKLSIRLDEWNWLQNLHWSCDKAARFRPFNLPLRLDACALQVRFMVGSIVFLNTPKKELIASRLPNVFHADVYTLLYDTVPDDLVDLYTHGPLCNVENNASAPVIVRVRHAFLDRRIAYDVNVIALSKNHQGP